jgi:hypothetical protein
MDVEFNYVVAVVPLCDKDLSFYIKESTSLNVRANFTSFDMLSQMHIKFQRIACPLLYSNFSAIGRCRKIFIISANGNCAGNKF